MNVFREGALPIRHTSFNIQLHKTILDDILNLSSVINVSVVTSDSMSWILVILEIYGVMRQTFVIQSPVGISVV